MRGPKSVISLERGVLVNLDRLPGRYSQEVRPHNRRPRLVRLDHLSTHRDATLHLGLIFVG